MRRLRLILILLSLALLTNLVLSISGGPFAEAGGKKIKTEFKMHELNAGAVPLSVRMGAIGTGEFKFDVEKQTFKLKINAKDLKPDHDYVVQVSVTEGTGAPKGFAWFPQGVATTDKKGKLKFEIENSPLVLKAIHPGLTQITEWRLDFEVFDLADSDVNGHTLYNLVCAPGTIIVLDGDGELVLFTG